MNKFYSLFLLAICLMGSQLVYPQDTVCPDQEYTEPGPDTYTVPKLPMK